MFSNVLEKMQQAGKIQGRQRMSRLDQEKEDGLQRWLRHSG
jgi:hypothetical protein